MDENNEIYREMRVETPQNFENILKWHDYVKELSESILKGEIEGFSLDMFLMIMKISAISPASHGLILTQLHLHH